MPADPNHIRIVDAALTNGNDEVAVNMTVGELILFHTLMQEHGIEYTGEDRFTPLMERNMNRIKGAR